MGLSVGAGASTIWDTRALATLSAMVLLRSETIGYNIGDGALTCVCKCGYNIGPAAGAQSFATIRAIFQVVLLTDLSGLQRTVFTIVVVFTCLGSHPPLCSSRISSQIFRACIALYSPSRLSSPAWVLILHCAHRGSPHSCLQGFALVFPCCSRAHHHWVQVDSNRTMVPFWGGDCWPFSFYPFWGHNRNQP